MKQLTQAVVAGCATLLFAPALVAKPPSARAAEVTGEDVSRIATPVGTIPRGITSFGACQLDGWLYVSGGYFGKPHHYLPEHQSSDFYRLDLHDLRRIESLPNEQRAQGCALVAHPGGVLRIGGMTVSVAADGKPRTVSLDACERFDVQEAAWRSLVSLPAPRSSHDAVLIGDLLYVVGGWRLAGDGGDATWYDACWVLDLSQESPQWTTLDAPFRRRAVGAAAIGRHLVVVGGIESDGRSSARVDVLDTTQGSWSRGPDLPGDGFGAACCAMGDTVVASGRDGRVYSWKPGSDGWKTIGVLTFPRFFHRQIASSDQEMLVLGGMSGEARPIHIESVRADATASDASRCQVTEWTVALPGRAKNRQGSFLHQDSLILFGGNDSVEQHDFEPQNFLDEAYRLDLATLSVSSLQAFPVQRQTMQTVIDGDRTGYAIGGFGHDGEVARTFADVFQFDFRKQEWSPSGVALPEPRSQFGAVLHDGAIWLFGGLDYDPSRERDDRFRHLTNVVRWQPSTEGSGFENAGVDLPSGRRAFAGEVLGQRYYMVGGMMNDFDLVESCDVFDFREQRWLTMAAPTRPRLSGQLVALHGRLYLAGGSSPAAAGGTDLEPNPSLEVYDPGLDTWSVLLEEIPFSPRHMQMFAYRGQLLLYSANDAERCVARLALIRPTSISS